MRRRKGSTYMPKITAISEKRYFIGANTSTGFVCNMSDILAGLKRIYIIKGGPGTGKSTLMKRIAEDAKNQGFCPELYYCSSDSESLDGLVIRELGVGIVDGTAPHALEARYAGAKEVLIDIGRYLDCDALSERISEIKLLSDEKRELFETVYKYLGLCKTLRAERDKAVKYCFKHEKAEAVVTRIMRRYGGGDEFLQIPRQIYSLGMNGVAVLPTYVQLCDDVITVSDTRGFAKYIFELFMRQAEKKNLAVYVSRDQTLEITSMMFPTLGLAVLSSPCERDSARVINTERFADRSSVTEKRGTLRFLSKLEKELMLRVSKLFECIKEKHFALEDIYINAMDFDGAEIIYKELKEKIFK